MAVDEQQSARARAERGIAELVPDALAVIAAVLRETKTQRNVAARAATARYVLDVVLGLPTIEQQQSQGGDAGGQVVRLTPGEAMRELRRRLNAAAAEGSESAGS